jgi:RecJ-like exonuclease
MSLDSWITGEGRCTYCGQRDCQCLDDECLDDDDEIEECYVDCPKCDGTGLAPEGFDCDYCDGDGEIEI